MEALNESVFDRILDLLVPEDMCRLECTCKTLQHLVSSRNRPLWKQWCERTCPSITVSLAKELVKAHYSREKDQGFEMYKRLCLKLRKADQGGEAEEEVGHTFQKFNPLGLGIENCEIGDYILLIDISLGDEGVLFQAADGKGVRSDKLVLDSSGTKFYRGDFAGVCKLEAEGRLCEALQGLVERTGLQNPSCALRLMHKATGEVLVLMRNRAFVEASHQLLDPPKISFVQHNFYLEDDWYERRAPKWLRKGRDSNITVTDLMLRVKYYFKKSVNATKERLSKAISREFSFTLRLSGSSRF